MDDLKYFEILNLNNRLKQSISKDQYNISVLSNITVNQFKEILELPLRLEEINAVVQIGDYDNIVQDSIKYGNSNVIIIFWEACNLLDGLHFKIHAFNDDEFNQLYERIKCEIDLVLKNLQNAQLILFNKFTPLCFSSYDLVENKLDILTSKLNLYLKEKIFSNLKIIDVEKTLFNVGIENSFDFRNYYSSKALYTINFYRKYTYSILPFIRSANGKSKKILIFDCDNTLWKGILGEDGFENIQMSSKTKAGQIFNEIQNIALELNKKGILLGICSKNNLDDVQKVIDSHPDMILKDENFTIKKVNWIDKATNIKEIASELNIGIDSVVFVDDSSFEINLIKETLPEVNVIQVPEKIFEYPNVLRSKLGLFYSLSQTIEDINKVNIYKEQIERNNFEKGFNTIEDFLTSLELNVTVQKNNSRIISRISQLSQKTNQFNLTTKRYTESDIEAFLNLKDNLIFTFSVSDKFGDNGIVGLCIVILDFVSCSGYIDTFLMSCRVIGRNIEFKFMDFLIEDLKSNNINKLYSTYVRTLKNNQVEKFYDRLGFSELDSEENKISYCLDLNEFQPSKINYINIDYDRC